MFIYRPDQYEKDTVKQNVAEIIIAKHRNGPVGSVELIFRNAWPSSRTPPPGCSTQMSERIGSR